MKTIYFITRSYPNVGTSSGGGALARQAQVNVLLKGGFNVKVVVPNPNGKTYEENNIIHIGFRRFKKFYSGLEKIGLIYDPYYPWVNAILKYFKDKMTSADYVMGVTGGSIDTLMAACRLKSAHGCKLILSYHDPVNYTTFNNLTVDNNYWFLKDKFEKKIIANADLIFTSSDTFYQSLRKKYNIPDDKISNLYFGYNTKENLEEKSYQFPLKIAYAGSFNKHQSPEILYDIVKAVDNFKLIYLGNYNQYPPLQPHINDREFLGSMNHADFLEFAKNNIDIGFVSLTSNYLAACFPSKIFEYINLGLPMLGALPDGDAKDFINKMEIGKAFHYSDTAGMIKYLHILTPDMLQEQRSKILKLKDDYYYESSLLDMCRQIENLK